MIRCCMKCNTRVMSESHEGKYNFECDNCGFKWTEAAHTIRKPEGFTPPTDQ
ncbi:MAG: hypothetical protein AABX47_09535 [Nanoarchaeota archaeon]